ncbi:hypothetical protein ACWGH3_15600 [Streptomyces sp. NPDC054884]
MEPAAHLLGRAQHSVVKQTAVRVGRLLVVVFGSPGLVDVNLEKALDKAQSGL